MSIEVMRQALEALENIRVEYDYHGNPAAPEDAAIAPAITALRLAIEQAEKQEPVAWWHDMGGVVDLNVSGRGNPLYTAPPQRQPLTIDQLAKAFADAGLPLDDKCEHHMDIAQIVERAHGIGGL